MHHRDLEQRSATLKHSIGTQVSYERKQHKEEVAKAQRSLQMLIESLRQLPFKEGVHTLSMDLFAAFEGSCGVDLPKGFHMEFGRQFNKACRDGRLPFKRRTAGRASLAAYEGLDFSLLPELMGMEH